MDASPQVDTINGKLDFLYNQESDIMKDLRKRQANVELAKKEQKKSRSIARKLFISFYPCCLSSKEDVIGEDVEVYNPRK